MKHKNISRFSFIDFLLNLSSIFVAIIIWIYLHDGEYVQKANLDQLKSLLDISISIIGATFFLFLTSIISSAKINEKNTNSIIEKIDEIQELTLNTTDSIIIGGYLEAIKSLKYRISDLNASTIYNTYISYEPHQGISQGTDEVCKIMKEIMIEFLAKPGNTWIDVVSSNNKLFLKRFTNKKDWKSKKGQYIFHELNSVFPILNFIIIDYGRTNNSPSSSD